MKERSVADAFPLAGPLILGLMVISTTFGGGTVLSRNVSINGAVVAPGLVIVDGRPKQVQHPDGGTVSRILVDDGVAVKEGDTVVSIDDTQIKAHLGVLLEQINSLQARLARLKAERDDSPSPKFIQTDTTSGLEANATELAQFTARRESLAGKIKIMNQQVAEFEQAAEGIKAELSSIDETIQIATLERAVYKDLNEKRLEPITRLLQLDREISGLRGRHGQRTADLAQTQAQISETRLKIIQANSDFRTSVLKDLSDAESQLRELNEKCVAAQDKLDDVDIRAPQSGIVQDMTVFTVGGVIAAGQTLMRIVPNDGHLVIEARVNPQDIDEVHINQDAIVRFTNFNRRLTPELHAVVTRVSADIAQPSPSSGAQRSPGTNASAATQQPYYAARIEIPDSELAKLDGAKMIAGMLVGTMIMTGERTVFSYLFKPLADRLALAFREK